MRILEELFPEFTQKLDEIDQLCSEKRVIDKRTYQFICFTLSIKARSKPCILKHFKGALEAGTTVKKLHIFLPL
jgi:alkylhydroperoxidase/carboxymuconolactone decarboxylase family protein YurZ